MDLTERILEKASELGHIVQALITLLAIFIIYAIVLVTIVAIFIVVSVMATLVVLMPFAITALVIIIITEVITYCWTVAPAGDGLVINLYAGLPEQGENGGGAGAAQGQDRPTNDRGDAINGRGWLRWWLGWWWWAAIVAVASYLAASKLA